MRSRRPLQIALFALMAAVAVWGWAAFEFLCDDAYITFRYVAQAQRGHGYVWNPEPFMPIEGYTSFLWTVMLHGIWWIGGVPPERSATVLGLIFGLGALGLVNRLAWSMPLSPAYHRVRPLWVVLVLLAIVTNRSWLAWQSSGLETALWTFVLLAWVSAALEPTGRRNDALWMAVTAVLPLVRPDGLLFLGLTPLMILWRTRRRFELADLGIGLPLAVPLAHGLWRFWTYGAWLPNTYYAKVVEPWPEMGMMHALLFGWEYMLFPWIALGIAALAVRGRLLHPVTMVGWVLALNTSFYLFNGGDHFAHRIFVHWIALCWLAVPCMLDQLRWPVRRALLTAGALFTVGLVLPWVHYAQTTGSGETYWEDSRERITPHFPTVLKPWPYVFDRLQDLMLAHLVGVRHHTHVAFLSLQRGRFPDRAHGQADSEALPVWVHTNPGYAAYSAPEVYVIDRLGLNDAVIARTPPPPRTKARLLAHERVPPPGYTECFRPNVIMHVDGVEVVPRETPLTASEVRLCEAEWRAVSGAPSR